MFVSEQRATTVGPRKPWAALSTRSIIRRALVLILGHTGCGAVGAALADETGEHIEHIVAKIAKAAGGETDPYQACCLNVEHAAAEVRQASTQWARPALTKSLWPGRIPPRDGK
ncbi:MAG: hypothetical protein FRC53_06960 [Pseudoramibacter sp. EUB1.1]|uniref:Carbonic anhydrase n=1 Tax=Candidatus Pseudoramibacter fermentans TaxID=2594427 RepID=A0A6L5GSI1_9FIRM|nr:hypothetical protein [Candidatus Pseudoramibacter fermentans]